MFLCLHCAAFAPQRIPLSPTHRGRGSLCQTNGTQILEKSNGRRHFCLCFFFFLFPICPSHGRLCSGTAGCPGEECGARSDALKMDSESQQGWFKRLNLVSYSMKPAAGVFRDGFLSSCRGAAARACTTSVGATRACARTNLTPNPACHMQYASH